MKKLKIDRLPTMAAMVLVVLIGRENLKRTEEAAAAK